MKNPMNRPGAAVRRANLERTLAAFNKEMQQKMLSSIAAYHTQQIEPRFQWLEMPWYKKLWAWLGHIKKRFIDGPPAKPHILWAAGTKLETTDIGSKHFDGQRQTGVVVSATDSTVTVQRDIHPLEGEVAEEPQEWSPSVWRRQKEPKDEGFVQGDPPKTL